MPRTLLHFCRTTFLKQLYSVQCLRGLNHCYGHEMSQKEEGPSRLSLPMTTQLLAVLATALSKFCLSGQLWNKICLSTFIDLLKFEVPMCFGVQVQVLAFLTVHDLLSVNQSGFRVKHSTETAIVISPIIF